MPREYWSKDEYHLSDDGSVVKHTTNYHEQYHDFYSENDWSESSEIVITANSFMSSMRSKGYTDLMNMDVLGVNGQITCSIDAYKNYLMELQKKQEEAKREGEEREERQKLYQQRLLEQKIKRSESAKKAAQTRKENKIKKEIAVQRAKTLIKRKDRTDEITY